MSTQHFNSQVIANSTMKIVINGTKENVYSRFKYHVQLDQNSIFEKKRQRIFKQSYCSY